MVSAELTRPAASWPSIRAAIAIIAFAGVTAWLGTGVHGAAALPLIRLSPLAALAGLAAAEMVGPILSRFRRHQLAQRVLGIGALLYIATTFAGLDWPPLAIAFFAVGMAWSVSRSATDA